MPVKHGRNGVTQPNNMRHADWYLPMHWEITSIRNGSMLTIKKSQKRRVPRMLVSMICVIPSRFFHCRMVMM